jgi:hypothetical protein
MEDATLRVCTTSSIVAHVSKILYISVSVSVSVQYNVYPNTAVASSMVPSSFLRHHPPPLVVLLQNRIIRSKLEITTTPCDTTAPSPNHHSTVPHDEPHSFTAQKTLTPQYSTPSLVNPATYSLLFLSLLSNSRKSCTFALITNTTPSPC